MPLIILMSGCVDALASAMPDYPFIHTTGFAYAKVQPDFGEVLFELTVSDADPEVALAIATTRLSDIRNILTQNSIDDGDIVIRNLKKSIVKSDANDSASPVKVELNCSVHIKIRDLTKWQAIMLPLLKLPNLDKFGTAFDSSKRDNLELDLAGAALGDARRRAGSLAERADKRIGAATAISEGRIKNLGTSFGLVSEAAYAADQDTRYGAAGARDDLLEIPPLKLQAAIDVIFELKPKTMKSR